MNVQTKFKRIPKDFFFAVRDITLLTSSLFAKTHAYSMKSFFRATFTATAWIQRAHHVYFYRSLSEYQQFSSRIGRRCQRNIRFTKYITQRLKKYTDFLFTLTKKADREYFEGHKKEIFLAYRDFFAFHQAVYWAGEYLSHQKTMGNRKIIALLDRAYSYNEMVIPKMESWFTKLGVGDFVDEELLSAKHIPAKIPAKNRSIIGVGKKVHILQFATAWKFKKQWDAMAKKVQKARILSGLSVTKGIVKGRVHKITDLRKLATVKRGDIVVTTMTRPQYNPFLKKAAGIITDEGGMLCHAAILSREQHIPCVVGTKIATQVFKNGDQVEVDANKGVVKKYDT